MGRINYCWVWLVAGWVAAASAGCNGIGGMSPSVTQIHRNAEKPIAEPVAFTLPHSMEIHSFTGARTFEGGQKGLEVLITLKDALGTDGKGDATKGFGTFLFEVYDYSPGTVDPKGELLIRWPPIEVMTAQANILHWNDFSRAYAFRLAWDDADEDRKTVLKVTFSSPFSERLFAQRKLFE